MMRAGLVCLALVVAGCQAGGPRGGALSYATPIPPARIISAGDLEGEHRVAGIEGVDFTSLPRGFAVSITRDRIAVLDDCVTTGWSYRFEGATLVTEAIAGPACRRALTPAERGLVDAFTGSNKVSRTPVKGILFEGTGGTVTLFAT